MRMGAVSIITQAISSACAWSRRWLCCGSLKGSTTTSPRTESGVPAQ